jgi:2-methylcitrate dehydratase PrpD
MITKIISNYLLKTDYKKIPDEIREKAKICLIDFLGVSLRGSKSKSGIIINKIISSDDESTVIGHKKSSCIDASLANGIFAHSLDLDDGHRKALLHPGACVIPAALSVCEAYNRNAKDFLTAIIVGYQIAIAMGLMVNPIHRNKGFHSTGTCGTFGAAAAVSKALGLRENEAISAIGLAGTQAGGLLESDHSGSMGKHLHPGKAASCGVLAGLLAKNGFSGSNSIIEGEEGFLKAMAYNNINKPNEDINLKGYHINNVYFKKYPVCRHLHSTLDAIFDIFKKFDLKNENIQKIKVKTYDIAANHNNYQPKSIESIRQSLPITLAIAIAHRRLEPENLEINRNINQIAKKIIIKNDKSLNALYPNKRPSKVIIHTKNKIYMQRIDLPKGEPENPYTKKELIQKFEFLNPEVKPEILDIIDDMESYKLNELMQIFNNEFRGY